MPRPLKPATSSDVHKVKLALIRLREARDDLAHVGATAAAAACRKAIGSTEGAVRHIERRARLAE